MRVRSRGGVNPERAVAKTGRTMGALLSGVALLIVLQTWAFGQGKCERFPAGSTVSDPENLYSENGVLKVDFTYQASHDSYGFTRYCFVNSDGAQSPTLHV